MKRELFFPTLLSLLIIIPTYLRAQSENCSGATVISVMSNCSSPITGNTGLTQNIPGCVGNADDDVWYQFTATSTSHQITVVPSAGLDPVVQLFSGTCSSLISLACVDNGLTGQTETVYATGLTVGQTYRIRIYHYYAGGGSTTSFTICITTPPPPPSNDNCPSAIPLTVNSTCTYTNATSAYATQSMPGCAGNADDDVWFSFVATAPVHTITVAPSSNMDPVVQLFSGTCGNLTSITCMDNTFTGSNEVINAVGLTPGNTYYIRVYDYYYSNGGFPFQICITGNTPPTPVNDDPCGAIQLPPVTSDCNYMNFSTVGATTSVGPGIPTPSSCAGGSPPQQGGFNNTPQPKDVWFAITVPSTGIIAITAQPGYGINDVAMALYTGTCTNLTQIACSDDYNYPGSANDMKPFLKATGLTPGSTVYLRYWAFNGNTTGNIGFCVTTNTNDDCANALYICDLNGYSGNTSAAYTIDRPCNMRGLAEMNNPPTYTYTPGTCQGGIFGLGGSWGAGAPYCDVRIDNNSWIRFTAANTTATLTVTVSDCFVGNYPSGGIQMQIFSAGSPCCNFTPVSSFVEGSSVLTITANNLTIGQDYYLMIDGYAGDICNYTITASGGVQFTDITASADTVCFGQSVTLTGPNGASGYYWQTFGDTTQVLVDTPATTFTYVLDVFGVCGNKQTISKTIYVENPPVLTTNSPVTVCQGQTINLNASGASSYQWTGPGGFNSTQQNPTISNAQPSNAGNYQVIGFSAFGCSDTAIVNVSVTNNPTATASANSPLCEGDTLIITASGGSVFNWSGPGGYSSSQQTDTILNVSTSQAGTYQVIVGSSGCQDTATINVVVNQLPVYNINSNSPVCSGDTIQLNTSPSSFSQYNWTGPNGFSSTQANVSIANASTANGGMYYVTVTNSNNCSKTDSIFVAVNNTPSFTTSSNSPVCENQPIILNVNTSANVNWTGPNGFSSNQTNVTINNATTSDAGNYIVTVTDPSGCSDSDTINVTVNPKPNASANSNSPICEGQNIQLNALSQPNVTYLWYSSNGFSSSQQNAMVNNAMQSDSGWYYLVVTNQFNCSDTDSVNVKVVEQPIAGIFAEGNKVCENDTIHLYGQGNGTFAWYYEGNYIADYAILAAEPAHDNSVYTLVVSNGTCSDTASITLNLLPRPVVDAWQDTVIVRTTAAQLNASGGVTYLWEPDYHLSCSDCPNPKATPDEDTYYCVWITNQNGCVDSACVFVKVEECGEIFVPNVFSPNGDGNNDVLKVYSNCIDKLYMAIYNRWGEKVFETDSPKVVWDGTYRGKEVNNGVFHYVLKATLLVGGQEINQKGTITIMK